MRETNAKQRERERQKENKVQSLLSGFSSLIFLGHKPGSLFHLLSKRSRSLIRTLFLFFTMVIAAAASAFFPVAQIAQNGSPSAGKASMMLGGASPNPPSSGGVQVKVNDQTTPKINGGKLGFMESGRNITEKDAKEDNKPMVSSPSRTIINQLPDWGMLLAAITTIFLAAEKQWTNLDWKPRRPDMLVDAFGLGRIVQDGYVFRQNFGIRSYEIGADKTASIETLMNHLQDTGLNQVKCLGILGDGFGSTPEMSRRDLIWVVTKMQVLVDRYPSWGDIVEVDTWFCPSGKNGIRRNWFVRDSATGQIITRATSVWVTMNKRTGRLSKIPEEVREELEPYFTTQSVIMDEDNRELPKLDDATADFVRTGLTPRWRDLDVNQHVNNVKYISWILETAPVSILESHELSSMTLEYRKECGRDSVLQSLTAVSCDPSAACSLASPVVCSHLLRLESGAEIARGRTEWKPKRAGNV